MSQNSQELAKQRTASAEHTKPKYGYLKRGMAIAAIAAAAGGVGKLGAEFVQEKHAESTAMERAEAAMEQLALDDIYSSIDISKAEIFTFDDEGFDGKFENASIILDIDKKTTDNYQRAIDGDTTVPERFLHYPSQSSETIPKDFIEYLDEKAVKEVFWTSSVNLYFDSPSTPGVRASMPVNYGQENPETGIEQFAVPGIFQGYTGVIDMEVNYAIEPTIMGDESIEVAPMREKLIGSMEVTYENGKAVAVEIQNDAEADKTAA